MISRNLFLWIGSSGKVWLPQGETGRTDGSNPYSHNMFYVIDLGLIIRRPGFSLDISRLFLGPCCQVSDNTWMVFVRRVCSHILRTLPALYLCYEPPPYGDCSPADTPVLVSSSWGVLVTKEVLGLLLYPLGHSPSSVDGKFQSCRAWWKKIQFRTFTWAADTNWSHCQATGSLAQSPATLANWNFWSHNFPLSSPSGCT